MANLSSWPEAKVRALAAALKGQAPATGLRGAFEISRSLPHGHVATVPGTIRSLGVEELISPVPCRQPLVEGESSVRTRSSQPGG